MSGHSFRTGDFVAQHVNKKGGEFDPEQIQPNGVEIEISGMKKLHGHFFLKNGGYNDPKKTRIPAEQSKDGGYHWEIGPGAYEASTVEVIEIPEGHIGIAFPRSRLLRCGVWTAQPLWDTGFKGQGSVTMFTFSGGKIDTEFRPFQIALVRADNPDELYEGVHGGRGLPEEVENVKERLEG